MESSKKYKNNLPPFQSDSIAFDSSQFDKHLATHLANSTTISIASGSGGPAGEIYITGDNGNRYKLRIDKQGHMYTEIVAVSEFGTLTVGNTYDSYRSMEKADLVEEMAADIAKKINKK